MSMRRKRPFLALFLWRQRSVWQFYETNMRPPRDCGCYFVQLTNRDAARCPWHGAQTVHGRGFSAPVLRPTPLRNLIAAGNELFWQVDGDQIWLRSAVRVAHCLGITRFRGQDVAIPVKALTGGIGKVRAHLFTAFHSGRDAAPVSRQTLARKSSIAPRTQRRYDRQSGVRKQANYADGPRVGSPEAKDLAWQHGPASFTWRDGKEDETKKMDGFWPGSYQTAITDRTPA